MASDDKKNGLNRRQVLGTTAAAAAAGVAGGVSLKETGMVSPAEAQTAPGAQAAHPANKTEVKPGDLDEYYVFFSGGQSGEMRIYGMPSMREFMRIPVFNPDGATGWGLTNESRKILMEGLTPQTRERLKRRGQLWINGDTHRPHMSFADGTTMGATSSSTTRRTHVSPASAAT